MEHSTYQSVGGAVMRTSAHAELRLPAWPDPTGLQGAAHWQEWLREVWDLPGVTDAIEHASPVLATRVQTILTAGKDVQTRRKRKVVASVVRYLLRAQHRPTPFGLFSGVAPAAFGDRAKVLFGRRHRAAASVSGGWLADVVDRLESVPQLCRRLLVVTNSAAFERDGRLIVGQYNVIGQQSRVGEVTLRCTRPVRTVLQTARRPVRWPTLAARIALDQPDASEASISTLITSLVRAQVLLTELRPPATVTDPLEHLLAVLEAIGAEEIAEAAPVVNVLRDARSAVAAHNGAGGNQRLRIEAERLMAPLSSARPLGVDLRIDAKVILPEAVARQAEQAAGTLALLSPYWAGIPGWATYQDRFVARYGAEIRVPLLELVHPNGLGFPAGYTDQNPDQGSEPDRGRNRWLLEQAQTAALDAKREVLLDGYLAERERAASDTPRPVLPPHTELNIRVESPSLAALDSGRFRLVVLGASRNAAAMAGRFADLAVAGNTLAVAFEASEAGVPVQLSFPPRHANGAHVVRVRRLLDHLISLGEHRTPGPGVIAVEDLAVGCDKGGLYLWSATLNEKVAPVVPHALNLRLHAPPLARFLSELPRARCAVLDGFDWGYAAHLPFLPRLRSGRTVFARARWRLHARELPPRTAAWAEWEAAWRAWAERRRLPEAVELGGGDQRLRLEAGERAHLALLRTHLDSSGSAVLTEAPTTQDLGWCGARAHELVIQLARQGEEA